MTTPHISEYPDETIQHYLDWPLRDEVAWMGELRAEAARRGMTASVATVT